MVCSPDNKYYKEIYMHHVLTIAYKYTNFLKRIFKKRINFYYSEKILSKRGVWHEN